MLKQVIKLLQQVINWLQPVTNVLQQVKTCYELVTTSYKRSVFLLRYVAVSREGVMTFWNMDLNLQRTILLNEGHYNSPKGNKTVWVTDCVVLANVKKIAVSTTERDIAFYDCAANNFEKHFVVCGFQHSVLCMDYWYNPENYNESALYFGDMNGQVYVLIFSSAATG